MRVGVPAAVLVVALAMQAGVAQADDSGFDFFEKKVRPVLVEHCYSCHSAQAKKQRGGLALDTRDALLKGGDRGPAIVPGKPDDSLLIRAVRHDDKAVQMTPIGKLPASAVAA